MPLLYYVQTSAIGLTLTLIICFHMIARNVHKSELRNIFWGLLISNIILLSLELLLNTFTGMDSAYVGTLLPIIICIFYIMNPIPEALWIFYLDAVIRRNEQRGMSKKSAIIICLPLVLNVSLSIISIYNGSLFYVDEHNVYHRGPYFLWMPAMCYIYLLYYIALIMIKRKYVSRQEFLTLFFSALPPIVGGLLQSMFFGLSILWIALTFSLLIVYMNLQSEQVYKEMLNLNKLKDQFLANTSHELRTPLNGIINITNSVLESKGAVLDEGQRNNLQVVVSAAYRLDSLINDILDISWMKNGEMKLKKRAVDLRSTANASMYIVSQLNKGKAIEFVNSIPDHIPPVYADEERLYQIFYNLIGNALKFTQRGQIVTGASLQQGYIEIWVKDTGSGIASDKLNDIFEPFYQVDAAETREAGGTGLGLSITRTLIELHGGSIQVVSEQGKGSCFTFTLPVSNEKTARSYGKLPPLPTANKEMPSLKASKVKQQTTHSILIADDDPANRVALFNILDNAGYYVTAVADGESALAELQKTGYDLVILDIMMPKMTGYEVLQKIRQRFQPMDLPVLLLTAKSRPEDLQVGFEAGTNDYLAKPFDALELRSRVKTLVQLKEAIELRLSAELSFLQAQIKPHFLFNSISIIAALCTKEPQRAKELLYHLSDYLRGSFNFEQYNGVTSLADELATLHAYVAIEKERFGGRLKIEYDVDDNIELSLPMLVIQPLVENALRHGILKKLDGGTVKLSVQQTEGYAVITIQDDGVGIPHSQLVRLLEQTAVKSGVGLINIHRRMIFHYGEGLVIESEVDKGTTVKMRIPLEEEVQKTGL